jgi:NMT1/THI5 like
LIRLRLAENFRAVFYAPFYATLALGHFASEGLDVTLVDSAAPGGGPAGLLAGNVDVTWGGPMRVMRYRDEGGPELLCFCEVVRRDPFYLVGRPPAGGFDLRSLSQLRLRDAFTRMTRAMARTQAWLSSNTANEHARTVAPFFSSISVDRLSRSLERYMQARVWADDTDVSREGFSRLAASLRCGGFISSLPDYDSCVVNLPH